MVKKKTMSSATADVKNDSVLESDVSPLKALTIHSMCGIGLGCAFYTANNVYSINLTENPQQTLLLLWVIQAPLVILLYTLFTPNYLKALVRGLLGLAAGAVVNALGAIVLGAPMIQSFGRTIHWSLLMSVLTFVPAASLLGSSWNDWHRIFAHTKPNKPLEYMISVPAHGAVIGAWFGAWPMPLDWERLWQDWPICVTFGAIAGYFVGMVASFGLVVLHNRRVHVKGD